MPDAAPRVGVPGAREIGRSDLAVLEVLDRLEESWSRATLRSELHLVAVLGCRLHEQLVLAGIVATRLLEIDVLAGLKREHGHRRVPVIGRRDGEGVDALVVEYATEVAHRARRACLSLGAVESLLDDVRVDVADIRDLGVRDFGEVLRVDDPSAVDATDGDAHCLVRRLPAANDWRSEDAQPGDGGLLDEVASIDVAHVHIPT